MPPAAKTPLFHNSADYLQPLVTPPYALLDFSVDSGVTYTAFTFGGLDTRSAARWSTLPATSFPGCMPPVAPRRVCRAAARDTGAACRSAMRRFPADRRAVHRCD